MPAWGIVITWQQLFHKQKRRTVTLDCGCLHEFWITGFSCFKYKRGAIVVQNLHREPHSSIIVRRFHKQKSCCHIIAIPQAGIAAPTLTVNARFWSKKGCSLHFLSQSCVLRLYSVFFHSTHSQPKQRFEPGCGGWKMSTIGGVEDTRLEAKAKDTKKIRGHGQGQPFRGQTLSRPRTGMLEAKAKDQGHKRKCSPKKKGLHRNFLGDLQKKGLHKNFLGNLEEKKKVFTKIFQAISTKKRFPKTFSSDLHEILTIQNIVLSSSRGQANFRGLEASRPRTWPSRPRPRTSKCVLEDSTSDEHDNHYTMQLATMQWQNVVFKPNEWEKGNGTCVTFAWLASALI